MLMKLTQGEYPFFFGKIDLSKIFEGKCIGRILQIAFL